MLICHRPGTNTSQLFRLQREDGELLLVTHGSDDAVAYGSYAPTLDDVIVFERSKGGSEEASFVAPPSFSHMHAFQIDDNHYPVFRRSSFERT
jgi:hypothetical protein